MKTDNRPALAPMVEPSSALDLSDAELALARKVLWGAASARPCAEATLTIGDDRPAPAPMVEGSQSTDFSDAELALARKVLCGPASRSNRDLL